jgi:hypothetical protein
VISRVRCIENSSRGGTIEFASFHQVGNEIPEWINLLPGDNTLEAFDHSIESPSNRGITHSISSGQSLERAALKYQGGDQVKILARKAQQYVFRCVIGHQGVLVGAFDMYKCICTKFN